MTCSSSARAWPGSATLMVCIPRARRRLEVDPEIVEEDRFLRFHAEGGAGNFVEAGIGFADPEDARFEDGVEECVHAGDLVGRGGRLRREVVRQARRLVGRPARLDGRDHLGTDLAGEPLEHETTVDLVAERARLCGPPCRKGVDADFVAFQLRPGVVVRIGGVDGADETRGKPLFGLEAGERLERAGRDDAAEIEHHRAYLHPLLPGPPVSPIAQPSTGTLVATLGPPPRRGGGHAILSSRWTWSPTAAV